MTPRARAAEPAPWWNQAVESRLADAGTNRVEITKALEEAPAAQRECIRFLVQNMPVRDLATLSSAFLLEDVHLAYDRWEKTPWKDSVPKEIFPFTAEFEITKEAGSGHLRVSAGEPETRR
jgi:hypothetical protein